MPKLLVQLYAYLRFIVHRFDQDRCSQIAASLTYTTLLSLVPVVTIVVSVISVFPVFNDYMAQLREFIFANLLPSSASKVISVYMQQFADQAAKLTALGIAFLTVTALILLWTIDQAFNLIWRVRFDRPLIRRLLVYWAILTLGPLLVGGSLSFTAYIAAQTSEYVLHPALATLVFWVVPVALSTLALSLLYFSVPNRYVPWQHALIGGLVGGVGFEIMKKTFAVYIGNFSSYMLVYGAFGVIPIFLIWIYLSWLTVLVGAEIAATLSHWRESGRITGQSSGQRFYDALRVLRALYHGQRRSTPLRVSELSRQVALGFQDLEEILDSFAAANWARKDKRNTWILIRDLRTITVADVYAQFVFKATNITDRDGQIDRLLSNMSSSVDKEMDTPLADLFSTFDTVDQPPADPMSKTIVSSPATSG